ncbi:alpha-L-rhamnosidase-related protein [Sphingomonas alpina]|uniref:Alpha-L-rhamnosidase six-hairpin glycosidase domain-containing protein n=1 Tax=Sphingomonas alpina TaxID=653931 RepID=A0A7H0LG18_9SPHN|nr:hypothetical protein [Sphingomonas alpina]QNQ08621.1 hypothetical protein H3Z74_18000 [Sphingomonas alpina]
MTLFRAPFIWTPQQPIAENWLLASRDLPARDDGKNRWFLFRTAVELEAEMTTAPTNITVDGRYILYVNGEEQGRGPVRCSPLAQRYDTHDIASALRPGRNIVAVLVHTYGVDTAFYEGVRGLWQPVFGDGGLWVEGPVVDTRQPWRCTQSAAWLQDVAQANHSLGFIEALDANELPADWAALGFDDSAWDIARPLLAGGGGPESLYQGMTVRPFPILLPRGIPALREFATRARSVRWIKGQRSRPDLPLHKRLYEEPLVPAPLDAARNIGELLGDGEASTAIRTTDGIDTAFTLDFGRIFSGHPFFEIEAKGGEVIEIACAERLPGEWSSEVAEDARIEPRPYIGTDAHLCRYVARPGRQRFRRFEWCAVRYMHVVVRNAPAGLTIRQLGAIETHYPVEERGRFSCSDPILTKLWAAGAYTLKQCMHDAWEDCPSREQRQWLGDVTVENLAAHAAFGNSASALTAKYLIQAAESQRPDGLTQMFAPGDHGHNARLIPDWTLQWILCAADYWQLTGDLVTLEQIWPSIRKALGWFERIAGPHGLVVDMPYWHFMDWAGLGRDHQALALNAQLAGAYRAAATISGALEDQRVARIYQGRARAISTRLDAEHWDQRRGAWVDMVDPLSGTQIKRTSQHGIAALALWGEAVPERIARAFDWATDPARETVTPAPPVVPHGTPLDEEHGVVVANTFYSHFVNEALARHGRGGTALDNIRRRFAPMIEAGSSTLWEASTPWASLCHGFSASPTHFLSRHVLGVAPAEPGFARARVMPNLFDLDSADGVVPAGAEGISVALCRQPEGFGAVIRAGSIPLDVRPPRGFRLQSLNDRDGATHALFARLTK